MPSTYSPDLRIELIANGEQSGTWGTTTNTNLGTLIEDAISGAATVTTAFTNQALTAANGAADQARCAVLILDTSTGAPFNVFAPPVTKTYVVKNSSAYNASLYCSTVIGNTTPAGAGYDIPAGKTAFVRSNGVAFFDAVDYIAGSVSFTNASLTTPSLSGETFSTAASVTAGTNLQGQGALTADYNIITSAAANPSGVTLPVATTGRRIIIVNKGANPINVFPATGAAIDALSTNASTQIPVDGVLEFNAASTTRWYSYSSLTLTSPLITTPSLVAAKVSTTANVTAGSNSQGQGALTSDYNVITSAASSPSGVTLPTATTGRKVLIVNKGANTVNVYPASGAAIDALGGNVSISLPANGVLEFNAASTTQWYSSFNATTAAGTSSVSFTGTAPAAQGQVTVYDNTTGAVLTTTRTYQFRATAAGAAQIQLYEQTTNGTDAIAIQAPAAIGAGGYALTLPTALPVSSGQVLSSTTGGVLSWVSVSGDVVGPGSATDNALVRFDATTGKLVQNSVGILSDAGALSGVTMNANVITSGTFAAAQIPTTLNATRLAIGSSSGNTANPGSTTWGFFTANSSTEPGYVGFNNSSTGTAILAISGAQSPGNLITFQYSTSSTAGGGTTTETGKITTTNTTVTYGVASDYRLKENVTPLTDAITKLKLLAPKRFTWKSAPEEGPVEGFIAHEVQEVVPTAVTGTKDAVDENGKLVAQNMDASFLVPLLTAALQEAVARIEALEARLANQ